MAVSLDGTDSVVAVRGVNVHSGLVASTVLARHKVAIPPINRRRKELVL